MRKMRVYRHSPPGVKPVRQRWSGPRPRKEDMIRIAHVTDVHFDEQYAPVSTPLTLTLRQILREVGTH